MAATYISTDVACSIIGDGRLDFQVRNGAGYDPPSSPTTKRKINTDVFMFLQALSFELLSIVKSLDIMLILGKLQFYKDLILLSYGLNTTSRMNRLLKSILIFALNKVVPIEE